MHKAFGSMKNDAGRIENDDDRSLSYAMLLPTFFRSWLGGCAQYAHYGRGAPAGVFLHLGGHLCFLHLFE